MKQKKISPAPSEAESERNDEQPNATDSARLQASAQIQWLQLIADNAAFALRRNPDSSSRPD